MTTEITLTASTYQRSTGTPKVIRHDDLLTIFPAQLCGPHLAISVDDWRKLNVLVEATFSKTEEVTA